MESTGIKSVRRLYFYHMLDGLFLGMCHRNLRRFVLETIHDALQTRDFFLLRIIVLHQLIIIFFLAFHEVRIISWITGRCAILNFIYHIYNVIKKHTVMGNNNDRLRIISQIRLQPLDRCDIQVVGRLIQKQNVRLAQKQFDKCDLRLLSAGKFR